jgi:stage 0 sporulation protein B (sporulation initiation phosphotransferase)
VKSKDVIQLIRLQRHDLMNELQIVHGYLSMGKIDKVKAKVNQIIEASNQERTLTNLDCPNFALWLIQVNLLHNHIRFTYDIHTDNRNMQVFDTVLTNIGNTILDEILTNELEFVEGNIQLKAGNTSIELLVTLHEQTLNSVNWIERMSSKLNNVLIQVQEEDSNVKFIFSIPA